MTCGGHLHDRRFDTDRAGARFVSFVRVFAFITGELLGAQLRFTC